MEPNLEVRVQGHHSLPNTSVYLRSAGYQASTPREAANDSSRYQNVVPLPYALKSPSYLKRIDLTYIKRNPQTIDDAANDPEEESKHTRHSPMDSASTLDQAIKETAARLKQNYESLRGPKKSILAASNEKYDSYHAKPYTAYAHKFGQKKEHQIEKRLELHLMGTPYQSNKRMFTQETWQKMIEVARHQERNYHTITMELVMPSNYRENMKFAEAKYGVETQYKSLVPKLRQSGLEFISANTTLMYALNNYSIAHKISAGSAANTGAASKK